MVYRGRPSTGCKNCRERKIKCDERLEGCVKCAERCFPCPGYDRTVDAFFHDETARVQAKAKKSNAKAIAARDIRDARHSKAASLQIAVRASPGMELTESLVDQGISFFMHHYSMGIDQPPVHSASYHKHLSTDGFHPLVATSMTAVGIAGVANLYMDPILKQEATRWYLQAIKMANAAISSPKDVKADRTLIAVNILSTFEATSNDQSLAGWSNHVDGAASLVKIRGMDQFSTPAGHRMYMHTVGLLSMNCMSKGIPLPQYVHDLNNEVMNYFSTEDPRNVFFFLQIKAIDLRAQIMNGLPFALADIIESALELDAIAIGFFKDKGPEWDYDVVLCDDQPGVFEHFYHIYSSIASAQTWNLVRYNRIYLHDIIRNSILVGFSSSPPTLAGTKYHEQLEESTRTLYKLQSDIIASMPQFLHDISPVSPSKTNYSTYSYTPDQHDPGNTDFLWGSPSSFYTSPPTSSAGYSTPSSSSSGGQKSFHENFRGQSGLVAEPPVHNELVTDRLPIVRISGGYSTVWAVYVAGAMPTALPS
ncbi:hypothetical protein EJ02DRAFT_515389, partial [Clathrospora elynae]